MKKGSILSSEALFKKYYPRLCHFAWQYLGDQEASEDIVQEAFTVFLERRDLIANDESAIRNYLYTTVRNACFNLSRDAKIEERYFRLSPFELVEDSTFDHDIILSEVMNEVYSVIATLPRECQRIFRLGYLEGWSNAKIADKLQVSINTVKSQKQRGLKLLKARLNPEFLAICLFLLMK